MNDPNKVVCDREMLISLRSIIQSMIISLNGVESRCSKEIEMIRAIDALGEKAVDILDQNLSLPKEP